MGSWYSTNDTAHALTTNRCTIKHVGKTLEKQHLEVQQLLDTMGDMNIPTNDMPAEQAPAIAPPIRTDDQTLPVRNWVPIDKSNCVLDILKPQKSPIS
ncbi:hypothetical protein Tco_0583256 [Tanacetum coccineum]